MELTKEQLKCKEIYDDATIETYKYNGVEFKTNNSMMDETVKRKYIELYQQKKCRFKELGELLDTL